ncbi:DUF445 domain-containing protein [Methylovirgula sp. 4M-Z18]|uniref:DUF445 domain-containing protein n=1 Tax=Methylovirgula sp. 4M-Z18 TaxID=2293567 RepID=UPI000E2E668C|nr:DUF445 domain-containing protein [Methylovirgula sp. 4M-Z18]RFB78397.1 DUF445 domain-containing protein [Methylovirgula sp. 4M-Z18]
MTSSIIAGSGPVAEGADLKRLKLIAHGVLAGCVVLLIAARVIALKYPAFSFLAACAEAATVGGVADWYAIVALFRKPLGLPIPHTAIIPNSQQRIAEKLGQFIEDTFLEAGPVDARLRQIDFAAHVAAFLDDRERCLDIAKFSFRLLPDLFAALETSGLKALFLRSVQAQFYTFDIAPFAAGTLEALADTGRHQQILGQLMTMIRRALKQPEMLAQIRDRIRAELPSLLKLYRIDAYLLKRIVASVASFAKEVESDPNHPFRAEFDQFMRALIVRLETDRDFAVQLNRLKRDVIKRGEIRELVALAWAKIKTAMETQTTASTSMPQRLAELLHEIGLGLATDPAMRSDINRNVATWASRLVSEHKAGVSTFIADQVKSWDMRRLVDIIEINVGRDLQYIRFNGMLIGGLVGLALYTLEALLGIR